MQLKNRFYRRVCRIIIMNEAAIFTASQHEDEWGRIGIAPCILALGRCVGSTATLNVLRLRNIVLSLAQIELELIT